ncbi:MAG: hypothetical protein FWD60_13920, partial [Candidatus Azobacteroides sp.]|nr:hypothetical protein [Candidatus Azobacteroides sp.]
MAKSIEYNIRFKAAIIYIIVAFGVIAMTVYLNNLRKNISSYRLEIENQHTLLSATNDLMFAVNNAQSLAGFYLSTRNISYFNEYNHSIGVIEKLIDAIINLKPNEDEKLHRIETLLRAQAQNIKKLNVQFSGKNPVAIINERLQTYDPYSAKDTLYTLKVRKDTVISELPHKGFFQRIGEVFKPGADSVRVVERQWIDTISAAGKDHLIIYEVGDIAQKAQKAYEQNIKMIEKQVGELLASDKEI